MKALPHNAEAEMAAIGCMFLSERAAQMMVATLAPDRFYVPTHRVIFEACSGLVMAGTEIDFVTARNALSQSGKLADAGGVDYLVQVVESVPTASNAAHYAGIVADLAARRDVLTICREIAKRVDGPDKTREIVEEGYTRFATVAAGSGGKAGGWVDADAVATQMFMNRKEDIRSRFTGINVATQSGYRRGEVYGCVAGTGGGKSAFLMQEVLAVTEPRSKENPASLASPEEIASGAFAVPCGVAYVSLELSAETLTNRAVQSMTGHRDCSAAESKGAYNHRKWLEAYHAFRAREIAIYDSSQARGMAWENIEREIKSLCSSRPIDAVVVDYFQMLQLSSRSRATKYEQLMEIAERMKLLALAQNIAVIFVSQLTLEREAGDLVDRFKVRQCPDAANPLAGLFAITKPKEAELQATRRVLTVVKSRFGPGGFSTDLFWDSQRLVLSDMGS